MTLEHSTRENLGAVSISPPSNSKNLSHEIIYSTALNRIQKTDPPYLEVSWNRGTSKSSTLMWFSIINHPILGVPPFMEIHTSPVRYSTHLLPRPTLQWGGAATGVQALLAGAGSPSSPGHPKLTTGPWCIFGRVHHPWSFCVFVSARVGEKLCSHFAVENAMVI